MNVKLSKFFPAVLILFHIIGLFLFLGTENGSDLTWMNLLLCGTLVFFSETISLRSFLIVAFIIIGGFTIELIGTKTGYLFGEYAYGEVLGWKLFGVSLIIGVNWYAIVLASANVARWFKLNLFLQALFAGILCVAMDFIIEPVAVKYGFWIWDGGVIPVFNYLTWFAFATFFSWIYLKYSYKLNITARRLYGIWFLFFLILNLI